MNPLRFGQRFRRPLVVLSLRTGDKGAANDNEFGRNARKRT